MMDLPTPTFSFSLPSINDGLHLECRVYLPTELQNIQSATTWKPRGAIVAHPYARLGGCYDDPVVSFIGGELLQAGYLVGTFNFRGAGASEGQTSWTAKSELEDYVAFYGFMLQFLQRLRHALVDNQPHESEIPDGDSNDGIRLILGGYSFGSLIASHAPDVEVLQDIFRSKTKSLSTKSIDEIGNVARKIVTASIRHLEPANPDHFIPETAADDSHSEFQPRASPSPSVSIAYLLVSPLLPPVSHFLTCFSTLSLNVGTGKTIQVRPDHQLSTHSTLILYGDQDTFTSAPKLQRWSAELGRMPQSRFQGREIGGAGHFWREDGVETRARSHLREWLRGI